MIQGVIFDMDGVLVDSEEYICEAAIRFFAENGHTVHEEDFIPFVGTGENRYIGGVAEKYGIPIEIDSAKLRVYEIYGELVHGILEPLEGVREFIALCKEKGLKLAVATSADRPKMIINLAEMALPDDTFDTLVNGSEIERKKPHPDIFLMAAHKLGLPPENCLVVEDAPSGIQAGKAAGSKCLGLMTSFDENILAQADWISHTLADAPREALEW